MAFESDLPRLECEWADFPWNVLTPRLALIVHKQRGDPISADLFLEIETAVEGAFILDPTAVPSWILTLLDGIIHSTSTGEYVSIPSVHPGSENDFINILLELGTWQIGLDDQGEDWTWVLPSFGVVVKCFREGDLCYTIRPFDGPFQDRRGRGRTLIGQMKGGKPTGQWHWVDATGKRIHSFRGEW